MFEIKDIKCKMIGKFNRKNKMEISGNIILTIHDNKIASSTYTGEIDLFDTDELDNLELKSNFNYKSTISNDEILTGITIGKKIK